QTGSGRICLWDSSNGKTIQEWAGSSRQWTQSPVRLDEKANRVCIAVQPHRIAMMDPESGVETWHHDLPQRGTLTGELPQLLGDARSLFVLVPRNYGMAIQRIDPVNGYSLWPEERRLPHATLTADQVTFDHRAIYYAAGDVLHAQNLANGQALWSLPMPMHTESWHLLRIGDSLLAAPNWTVKSHPSRRDFI